ncbi:MAG: ABC transporter, periplasmic spermidine putrescine-binding protein potD (TC_3.A.1.11.1) [Arenicellales bacterium IbO2]|nr:extracellular solute-binding protein [Gammaproteobacteria bacterium]MDA8008576.1 extracellular solute-binding protein [Alphaproteobacteria bacterium]MDA8011246.1 extracellular solute-binding protein [Gammaproteobacteria bacterium]MDA8030228.1 extracellular solute-binding protein [Alphaproteobacteria bacterium]CAJ2376387.1 MAG: ABC transporter, periplasmic spermidine putrescine-binding protein potD (TC_3.A.1.11.1) [Arenicellales bacterium IbO2]
MKHLKIARRASAFLVAMMFVFAPMAQAQTLRILTWGGYIPDELVKKFKSETGIDIEITTSNNEEMISKLRATRGAGFDLAQPSQDRITGPQLEYGIYRPMDISKIDRSLFDKELLAAAMKNTTVEGKVYGVPYTWGVSGLVVNKKKAPNFKSFNDLCSSRYKGRVSMRLKRTILIGMGYAAGEDPFAAYDDLAKYKRIAENAGKKLIACKPNVKAYWKGGDDLSAMLRSGEIVASGAWDGTAFKLNAENPDINFVPPDTGALGWIDTFVLPAKSKAEDEAYQWINFVMKQENARIVSRATGYKMGAKNFESLLSKQAQKSYKDAFSAADVRRIKWFPPIPPGLEDIEGKILERVKAATGS